MGTPTTTEGTSLDTLFSGADIDDASALHNGEEYRLRFTVRATGNAFVVEEETLDEAIAEATRIIAREERLERLRQEGLTEADLDRLVDGDGQAADRELLVGDYYDDADEAWHRGYNAGDADATKVWEERANQAFDYGHDLGYDRGVEDAARNIALFAAEFEPQPVSATAAEPVETGQVLGNALDQHPLISVVYAPVLMVQHQEPFPAQREAARQVTQG